MNARNLVARARQLQEALCKTHFGTPLSFLAKFSLVGCSMQQVSNEAAIITTGAGCFMADEGRSFDDTVALVRACHVGHEAAVKLLLAEGLSPSSADAEGNSALCLAAGSGHSAVVRILLDARASLEETDANDQTPFSLASMRGRKEVIRELLDARADLESVSTDGLRPLMMASRANQPQAVNLLLSANADVNAVDEDGATALIWAASSGCTRVLPLLLAARADLEIRDIEGATPLAPISEHLRAQGWGGSVIAVAASSQFCFPVCKVWAASEGAPACFSFELLAASFLPSLEVRRGFWSCFCRPGPDRNFELF